MNYRVANHKILVDMLDDGNFEIMCENIFISRIQKDLLTGAEIVDVTIEFSSGERSILTLPREKICTSIIPELAKYGLSCVNNSPNNETVQCILFDSASQISKEYYHNKLGFVRLADETVFLHYHPIGVNNPTLASSTHQSEDVKPRGALHGWRSVIKQQVYKKGHMELALAIGAVAPVAHLLLEAREISEIPMFSLVGQSTSGKTTALILASSLWYSSSSIADFNCTSNAFIAQMAGALGLPMLVDESSAVADWDFTNLLYNAPKGKSKLRCTSNGSLQARLKFSGCIVYTGERSLIEQTTKTRGLEARLFELSLPWTESAKHAESLTKGLSHNYGVAAEPLMTWILENQEAIPSWYRGFSSEFKKLCAEFLTDDVLKRLAKMASIIITSASVLNTALDLELSLKNITHTLLAIIREKCSEFSKSPENWYEKLKNFTLENVKKFPSEDEISKVSQIWGYKKHTSSESLIWIREDIFENYIHEITSVDLNIVKKLLAEKGFIMQDEGRHYKFKKKIRLMSVNCYGLYLTPQKTSKIKRKVKKL